MTGQRPADIVFPLTYSPFVHRPMNHYELLCISPGTLAETELPEHIGRIQATVEQGGGSSLQVTDLGKSRLAYPINHIRYGYFTLVRFQAEPQVMQTIQEKLRLLSGVLRSVIRRYNPATAGDTPTSQATLNEIVRGGSRNAPKERSERPERAEKSSSDQEKDTENQQNVEKTDESAPAVDTAKKEQVPLEQIGEQLDEILEKSISNI